ncbi:ATP-dependent DNA helicase PIF6-like [Galendromus occidentalis]|uniref:ATP-dependent DNA helicase PIF6-like n=1 Tax=Galendromus occidentalis TaxID=34638 RepID=A0AAJ6QRG9_9ACAR|nr:ATP-dependent DNA helicase PIF6-like [Galendromus occidentalis]
MTSSKEDSIENVFPQIAGNYTKRTWLSARAVLAPTNSDVDAINLSVQKEIPGCEETYKPIDTVLHQNDAVNYPTEFPNSLDLPGMPPHLLKSKEGVTIICFRNIHPPRLCNGTRLSVKKLTKNVIEAAILSGKFGGEHVLLPRIPLTQSDITFEFRRLQFPVRLAFAMTINKAQGQSLQVRGLNLENLCFSHGQLYVACSRVGKPANLFVYTTEGEIKNIVYAKALI